MKIFYLTLEQMLMMFFLIAVGYFLRKKKLIPENTGAILAKLETFIFVPALSLYTQMTRCTVQTFRENAVLMLYGLGLTLAAIGVAYLLARLFVPKAKTGEKRYERNLYTYAATFGNFGFMGNFIVLGIWGEEMFFKYSLFCFFISILCNSWGLFILIPKDQNAGIWQNLKKGLVTPPVIALVVGMALGLTGLAPHVPGFLVRAFETAGDCQGPVAMVLAGIVIGGYRFGKLLKKWKVYIITALRLAVIPAAMLLILKLCRVPEELLCLALVAFATPMGLNTIVFPAAYGGDTETGASMAMISHTLSVVTIPLMYLVFVVLL